MSRSVAEMLGRQARTKMLPLDVNWPLPENLMGIELEIENPQGSRRAISDTTEFRAWSRHQDGSLANGREYVLRTPLAGKQLTEAIAEIMMYGPFDKNMRGSTHIHMDMLDPDTSHETLRILILLVYSLEPVLYAVGDKGRMYCGFCNPMETGDAQVIRDAMNPDISPEMFRDRYNRASPGSSRYYGLNLLALGDYGSLEFRYFPTASTAEELVRYTKLVQCFKKAALSISTVDQLLAIYSNEDSFRSFISTNFPDYMDLFQENTSFILASSSLQKARIVCSLPERVPNTRANLDSIINSKKWEGLLKKTTRRKIQLYELSASARLPENPKRGDVLMYNNRIYVWGGDNWLDGTYAIDRGGSVYDVFMRLFNKQHHVLFANLLSEYNRGARPLSDIQLQVLTTFRQSFEEQL